MPLGAPGGMKAVDHVFVVGAGSEPAPMLWELRQAPRAWARSGRATMVCMGHTFTQAWQLSQRA